MDVLVLWVFEEEVAMQCRFIKLASEQLDEAWPTREPPMPDPPWSKPAEPPWAQKVTQGWFALQALLPAAANISKLLWGSKGERAEERKPLRAALGVEPESVFESASLRNDFEHFDERLMRWLKNTPPDKHSFVGRGIWHDSGRPLLPTEHPRASVRALRPRDARGLVLEALATRPQSRSGG